MSFNCMVKCTNDDGGSHTLGKIYSVVDGKLSSDDGFGLFPSDNPRGSRFKDLDHINHWSSSTFELYVEPKTIKEILTENKYKVIIVKDNSLGDDNYGLLVNDLIYFKTCIFPLDDFDYDLRSSLNTIEITNIFEVPRGTAMFMGGVELILKNAKEYESEFISIWERLDAVNISKKEIAEKFGIELYRLNIID